MPAEGTFDHFNLSMIPGGLQSTSAPSSGGGYRFVGPGVTYGSVLPDGTKLNGPDYAYYSPDLGSWVAYGEQPGSAPENMTTGTRFGDFFGEGSGAISGIGNAQSLGLSPLALAGRPEY
jgi:hypothetical protein